MFSLLIVKTRSLAARNCFTLTEDVSYSNLWKTAWTHGCEAVVVITREDTPTAFWTGAGPDTKDTSVDDVQARTTDGTTFVWYTKTKGASSSRVMMKRLD